MVGAFIGAKFTHLVSAPVLLLLFGALLLLAYGIGHCAAIVVARTSTELVQRFLNWNEQSKGVAVVKNICGLLVILGGVWLIYTAP
jgi:cytochrome c-type biogenesis protein